MKCLHPRLVKNPVLGRYIEVPCRKCPCCLHNRQKEWAFRLMQEDRYSDGFSYFITLTFDDNLVPDISYTTELDKQILSDFLKRLRRKLEYHNITKFMRYFACGEYGDLGRAHYHFILFGVPLSSDDLNVIIQTCWPYGFITVSPISDSRCMYVAKYTCKELFNDDFYNSKKQKPFASMSSGHGHGKGNFLGSKFLKDEKLISRLKDEQMFYVRSSNGSVFNLPRPYKKRIFTPYEIQVHNDFLSLQDPIYDCFESGFKAKINSIAKDLFYEQQFFKRLQDERKIKLGF